MWWTHWQKGLGQEKPIINTDSIYNLRAAVAILRFFLSTTYKGKTMTTPLEQSLDRLEQAVQNFSAKEMQHKTLDRPVFETKEKGTTNVQNFVKHGEKALSSQDGTGSLVIRKPSISSIVEKPVCPALFRDIAGRATIQSDHLEIVREKGNTDSGWANETTLGAETNVAELMKIIIPAHEMYARTRISQRLIDDAVINLESWLMDSIEQRFSQLEEDAFINGSGDSMPKGFLKYERVADEQYEWGKLVERRTGQNGAIVNADILLDTVSSLKTPYLAGAMWVMSRSAFAEIRRLKEPTTGRYLWQPSLTEGGENSLLGFPIILSDAMPALKPDAPSTAIAFGNFTRGYQIVDRGEFTILRDPYSAKPLVEFYVTQRLGGDVVDFEAIKLITAGE